MANSQRRADSYRETRGHLQSSAVDPEGEAGMLGPLGLSVNAETVYRAMLINQAWGVDNLVGYTALSLTEVQRALDELADVALIRRAPDPPGIVRIASPQAGLAALLARAQADIVRRQQEIEATRAAIAAIATAYETSRERDTL